MRKSDLSLSSSATNVASSLSRRSSQSAVLPERDEPRSGPEVQPEEPRELGFGFVPLRLVLDRDENLSLPVRVAHAFHLEPIHRLCIREPRRIPRWARRLLGGCGAVCGGRGRRRWVQPDFHAAHKLRKLRFGFRVVVTPRGAVGALVRRQHAPLHVQGPARILALRRVRLLPRVVHVYANRARVPRRALQRLVHLGFLPRQRRVHPALELLQLGKHRRGWDRRDDLLLEQLLLLLLVLRLPRPRPRPRPASGRPANWCSSSRPRDGLRSRI